MTDVFFNATKNALNSITCTFDSVWPTVVGLWNLRCAVNDVKKEHPEISEAELAAKFTLGSGVHGVNYKRAFSVRTWEQQQSDFAWILLNSTIPIYEEWLCELQNTIFPSINVKAMQFPNKIHSEVSRLTANRSTLLTNAYYSTYLGKRERNYAHIYEMMLCYRAFKEARNCFMHRGASASQEFIDANNSYNAFSSKGVLCVKEVPMIVPHLLGDKIQLSLRSVVGFSYILIKILVSLDTELIRSENSEIELINRFKQRHASMPTLKADSEGSRLQVIRYMKHCGFPEPQSVDEVKNYLLKKHLVSK